MSYLRESETKYFQDGTFPSYFTCPTTKLLLDNYFSIVFLLIYFLKS